MPCGWLVDWWIDQLIPFWIFLASSDTSGSTTAANSRSSGMRTRTMVEEENQQMQHQLGQKISQLKSVSLSLHLKCCMLWCFCVSLPVCFSSQSILEMKFVVRTGCSVKWYADFACSFWKCFHSTPHVCIVGQRFWHVIRLPRWCHDQTEENSTCRIRIGDVEAIGIRAGRLRSTLFYYPIQVKFATISPKILSSSQVPTSLSLSQRWYSFNSFHI